MKKLICSVLLISLISCNNLTLNVIDIIGNNVAQDKGTFLKKIVKTYKLIDTIDAGPGYNLQRYIYKDVFFTRYKKNDSKNVLIYVHGGAFVITDILSPYYKMNKDILEKTNKDYEILLLDYKGKLYPNQSEELEKILEYAFTKYNKIVVMGDSSGGNIVLSAILKRRDNLKKLPDGLVLLSPWADLTNSVKSRKLKFNEDVLIGKKTTPLLTNNQYIKNVTNKKSPYVSPIFANYKNFPKTLIQCGEREVLLDDSRLVYENMKKNNVDVILEIYPNMIHVFQLFRFFDKTGQARSSIAKFLRGIY